MVAFGIADAAGRPTNGCSNGEARLEGEDVRALDADLLTRLKDHSDTEAITVFPRT